MEPLAVDAQFVGSVPDLYERLLVPMIFAEPAERLADTIAGRAPTDVLETAAGTGVLTRAVGRRCPSARLTATDLNQPMIDVAAKRHPAGGQVTWQQADAQDLPFNDESFDVVACQFGSMFFPDKVRAYAEARRVLRRGGAYLLTVWDRIETSEIPDVIQQALIRACPDPPLLFMSRTPHGYFDIDEIRQDLGQAGFASSQVEAVEAECETTAADAAIAYCQGTPLRGEIGRHPGLDVESATRLARQALLERFGSGSFTAPIRWIECVASD